MARLFDDGSNQYCSVGSAAVAGYPATLAAWGYADDVTAERALLSVSDNDTSDSYKSFTLELRGADAGDPVAAKILPGHLTAISTSGITVNTWFHAAAIFYSITSMAAFLNGGNKGTGDPDYTPISELDTTTIGQLVTNNNTYKPWPFSGAIAHAAIWNVALTDAEVLMLARGKLPSEVRPASLVAYWPLVGHALTGDNDLSLSRRYLMTPYNGPTWTSGPRMVDERFNRIYAMGV